MNHTEADYINAGVRYESASTSEAAQAAAYHLRAMLSSEKPADQTYALQLIERGRAEGRK